MLMQIHLANTAPKRKQFLIHPPHAFASQLFNAAQSRDDFPRLVKA